MSKDDIINKLVDNKILVGCITAGIIAMVGILWNMHARVSVIESTRREMTAMWSKCKRNEIAISDNRSEISFLKGSHHER